MNNIFSNQKGFGLIDSLVGIGILAAVSLGGLYLSSSQRSVVSGSRSDLNHTIIRIREQLNVPAVCRENLLNKKINTDELTEIVDVSKEPLLKLGQDVDSSRYKVESIKVGDYRPESLRTLVKIEFKNNSGSGLESVNKFFGILTKVESGVITECLDPQEFPEETMFLALCLDADPLEMGICEDNYQHLLAQTKRLICDGGSSHKILRFDSSSGRCLSVDAGKGCGSGFVRGFDASGNPVCYTPVSP